MIVLTAGGTLRGREGSEGVLMSVQDYMIIWTAGGALRERLGSKGVLTSVQDYINSMDSR